MISRVLRTLKLGAGGLFLTALTAFGFVQQAQASVIFLAGSEAASFHRISAYTIPVFQTLQGSSALPVLVVNDFGASSGFYDTGAVSVVYMTPSQFLSATLTDYSALFFASPGTCCSDPYSLLGTRDSDVAGYVGAGGGLYVEDYQANARWDPIIGVPGAIAGVTSGAPFPECLDPGVSTPGGIAFGFAPSYTLGCFQHQTYDPAFWAARGYFALQTSGYPNETFGDWITMATGFRDPDPTTVPEPGTLGLLVAAGLALISSRRLRRR
jgi:hypothetical protein